jgi:hypothetical protein
VAMCTAAMNEKKPALARSRRLARPMQVVDPAPATITNCDCPGWEMAHRNQSGAGARIVRRTAGTASLLKEAARALLDRPVRHQPTLYRTKDPAHSVTPRQQRDLAVRGASSLLEHPASRIFSPESGSRARGNYSLAKSRPELVKPC